MLIFCLVVLVVGRSTASTNDGSFSTTAIIGELASRIAMGSEPYPMQAQPRKLEPNAMQPDATINSRVDTNSSVPTSPSECIRDSDCKSFPMYHCVSSDEYAPTRSVCKHKHLFGQGMWRDFAAAVLIFVFSGLALSVGIGGGGLYVPLMILLMKFRPHVATGLSHALLAGGATSTLVYNMRHRHSSGLKPVIDYNLVLVILPNLLVGAFVGSAVHMAAPGWLILVLLTTALSQSAWKTLQKAHRTLSIERGKGSANGSVDTRRQVEIELVVPQEQETPPGRENLAEAGGPVSQSVLSVSQDQYPRMLLLQFGGIWIFALIAMRVRGGRQTPGLVPFCSTAYWTVTAVSIAALGCFSILAAKKAIAIPAFDDDDFRWSRHCARRIVFASLGAGTLASMCGIGSGMLMGPVLLDLGVAPQVQTATTATTLFVFSSTSAAAYLLHGTAPFDYALFFSVVACAGAVIGKALVQRLIDSWQRPSITIFMLGGLTIASLVVIVISGITSGIEDIKDHRHLGFANFCANTIDLED